MAVVNYYDQPDAATLAILAARGDSVNIIPRGSTVDPQGNLAQLYGGGTLAQNNDGAPATVQGYLYQPPADPTMFYGDGGGDYIPVSQPQDQIAAGYFDPDKVNAATTWVNAFWSAVSRGDVAGAHAAVDNLNQLRASTSQPLFKSPVSDAQIQSNDPNVGTRYTGNSPGSMFVDSGFTPSDVTQPTAPPASTNIPPTTPAGTPVITPATAPPVTPSPTSTAPSAGATLRDKLLLASGQVNALTFDGWNWFYVNVAGGAAAPAPEEVGVPRATADLAMTVDQWLAYTQDWRANGGVTPATPGDPPVTGGAMPAPGASKQGAAKGLLGGLNMGILILLGGGIYLATRKAA